MFSSSKVFFGISFGKDSYKGTKLFIKREKDKPLSSQSYTEGVNNLVQRNHGKLYDEDKLDFAGFH